MGKSIKEIVKRIENSDHYTVFVVGDSITEGDRASSSETNFVACFTRGLSERFPERRVVRYDGKRPEAADSSILPLSHYEGPSTVSEGDQSIVVVKSGVGGNSVRRVLDRRGDFIGKKVEGHVADLYIIMLGINDSMTNRPQKYVTPEVFEENYRELLLSIETGNPDADILLMTPTYDDEGKTATSRLEPYVDRVKKIVMDKNIPLVDQHRVWMDHLTVGGDIYGQGDWLSGVEGDCCHPSDIGHRAIADELLRSLFQ